LLEIKSKRNIVNSNSISVLVNYGIALGQAKSLKHIKSLIENDLPDLREIAIIKFHQFSSWCLNILANNPEASVNEMLDLYRKINLQGLNKEGYLKGYPENITILPEVLESLSKMSPKEIQFYMIITLQYFTEQDHLWDSKGKYEHFLSKSMDLFVNNNKSLEYSINTVSENIIYFSPNYS
ncbi:MAG: hypothetical protein H7Y18_07790, partial [Clostridiaceae bacterium]|nr:hypothetical protein [Clostridiaceae bacterium]